MRGGSPYLPRQSVVSALIGVSYSLSSKYRLGLLNATQKPNAYSKDFPFERKRKRANVRGPRSYF